MMTLNIQKRHLPSNGFCPDRDVKCPDDVHKYLDLSLLQVLSSDLLTFFPHRFERSTRLSHLHQLRDDVTEMLQNV